MCKREHEDINLQKEDKDMEVALKRNTNTYVKADKGKVLDAIKKCNKKYAKAMRNLAK